MTLASRLHWRLLIATVLVLMAAAWLGPRLVPAPTLQEHRVLAPRPVWPKRLEDLRAFRQATDAYVADRFPARVYLIAALNRLRMMVGVSGSSRVIVGRDGWLFWDDDTHLGASRGDPPMTGLEIRDWLAGLAGRTEFLRARGIRYLVIAPPTKEAIYPGHGPAWYAGPAPGRAAVLLPRLARDSDAGEVLYLQPAITLATKAGAMTYSRHDTHWSGLGAFAGYVAIMDRLQAMGLTDGPRPLAEYRARNSAGHGPRDLALMLGVASFVDLDYPRLERREGAFKIDTTYLTAKRDWTAPQVIDTHVIGKPVLLMTRDSFSNEMLQFLYPHFRRIVVAHDQDGFWRPDLIDRFKPDIVITEVVEPGLRVAMGDSPAASAQAMARIDRVLATAHAAGPAPGASLMPRLAAPDQRQAAAIAAARPGGGCAFDAANLAPGGGGQATLVVSGWASELATAVTSPDGLIALTGPKGRFVSALRIDKPRPDVADHFRNPSARSSGFAGDFYISKLPAGTYDLSVYRRAGAGWMACTGPPALVAP
ncbi:alginate O-acetyltransferase AlgX-related protein [Phenylobacterium sp.]|uniref:alginate O-acetyltransferase AlgX-related protein n=1 Tax=Phenylobacterium sp. TaxID=1871053 RepID=UPI00286BBBCD|nr:hypothetical protein [Phenylobacterium sp.]